MKDISDLGLFHVSLLDITTMKTGKQLKALILLVVVLFSSSAKGSLIRPSTNPKSHSTTSGISLGRQG